MRGEGAPRPSESGDAGCCGDSPVFRASRFLLTNDDSRCVLAAVVRALCDLPNGRAAGSHPDDTHALLHLGPVGDSEGTAQMALGNPGVPLVLGMWGTHLHTAAWQVSARIKRDSVTCLPPPHNRSVLTVPQSLPPLAGGLGMVHGQSARLKKSSCFHVWPHFLFFIFLNNDFLGNPQTVKTKQEKEMS